MAEEPRYSLTISQVREAVQEALQQELNQRARIDPQTHQAHHEFVAGQMERLEKIANWAEARIDHDRERAAFYADFRRDLERKGVLAVIGFVLVLLAIGAHEWFNDWLHKPAIPGKGP